jgi:hypothetical protein
VTEPGGGQWTWAGGKAVLVTAARLALEKADEARANLSE